MSVTSNQTPPAGADAVVPGAQSDETIESLPAWAQAHIKDLRAENASARVSLREAEQARDESVVQLADLEKQVADGTASAESLTRDLESERFERLRDRLIAERGLPNDIAAHVRGDDEASLTQSLDALAALQGASAPAHVPTRANPALAAGEALDPEAERAALAEQFFSN